MTKSIEGPPIGDAAKEKLRAAMNDNKALDERAADAGFKNKKNIYTCDKCFGHIVTVDRDEGVTPFMLRCRATLECVGDMQSSMYRVFDQRMKAAFEWYKPGLLEIGSLGVGAREHVDKGGLLLRKI